MVKSVCFQSRQGKFDHLQQFFVLNVDYKDFI